MENSKNKKIKVAIIGGSGFDDPKILDNYEKKKIHTPYGSPSDLIVSGIYKGVEIIVIPRHGDSYRIYPSSVNFKANIWACKELEVTHIVATTACGSLREDFIPGDLVFIDQFIDRTTKRDQTFYEGQEVCHISMADPFCDNLRELFSKTAK